MQKRAHNSKNKQKTKLGVECLEDRVTPAGAVPFSLTHEQLAAVAHEGVQRWIASGISPTQLTALQQITYDVADLGAAHLGLAEGSHITIDDNAAGNLWFVDPTPDRDEEFTAVSSTRLIAKPGTPAQGKTDLLTVVLHEQGHVLGLADSSTGTGDLMRGVLSFDQRILPSAGLAEGAEPGTVASSFLVSGVSGESAPIDNRQPFLTTNYAISLAGTFPIRDANAPLEPFDTGGTNPVLGSIYHFAFDFAPQGYALAQGQILLIDQNEALFALLGTNFGGDGRVTFALPDLRGRTPIGVANDIALGEKSGSEQVILTEEHLPAHQHSAGSGQTGSTGGDQPHSNMMPALGLNPIIDRNGEIRWVPFNFAPRGSVFARGQRLPIVGNEFLFANIGTRYGGDGRLDFAVPDLRGRIVVDDGHGAGLTPRSLASLTGTETVQLTISNLPGHRHSIPNGGTTQNTGSGQSITNMQPSMALNFQIAQHGTFPTRNLKLNESGLAAVVIEFEPFFAEIHMFAGPEPNTVGNFNSTSGQLLSVINNEALFALLGTTYGGDGRNDFGLPDFRGRAPVGIGMGSGLSDYALGQRGGTETTTLTLEQMAAHSHDVNVPIGDQSFSYQQDSLSLNLGSTSGTYSVQVAGTRAWFLDRDHGLNFAGDDFQNFGGLNERWLQGIGGQWYFITPAGEFFQWDGTVNTASGTLLAHLDPIYYHHLEMLYDAADEHFARAIDQQLGQTFTGDLYENYGGWNERWLQGIGGQWYFITPSGQLYQWDGTLDTASGTLLANLDPVYYAEIDRLYNAQPAQYGVSIVNDSLIVDPVAGFIGELFVELTHTEGGNKTTDFFEVSVVNGAPVLQAIGNQTMPTGQDTLTLALSATDPDGDAVAYSAESGNLGYLLDHQYRLSFAGSDFQNYGGMNERWLQGSDDQWYFIKPNGEFYEWDGAVNSATGALLATLDPVFYHQLDMLHNASDEHVAYAIDQRLGLNFTGNLYQNYGGLNERWLQGNDGFWYFMTPSGQLYLWDGADNSATGTLLAHLDAIYYTEIERLHTAQPDQFVVSVIGDSLIIDPVGGFVGRFWVMIAASDGSKLDSEVFSVAVAA